MITDRESEGNDPADYDRSADMHVIYGFGASMSRNKVQPLPTAEAPDAARSRTMAAVKSRNTKPEMYVRRKLHAAGYRYRLHSRALPGKPDIVLSRYSTVVLIHGCFWHRHGCKPNSTPTRNSSYWRAKIERNVARDLRNMVALEEAGWNVVTIWECEIGKATESLINHLGTLRKAQRPAG